MQSDFLYYGSSQDCVNIKEDGGAMIGRRRGAVLEREREREREMSTGNKSIYEMLSKSFCYMEQFITPIAWLSESFVPACLAWKVPHYLCYGKLKRSLVFHPLG